MKQLVTFVFVAVLGLGAWWLLSQSPQGPAVVALGTSEGPIRASVVTSPEHPQAGEETMLTFSFTDASGMPVTNLMGHHTRKVHVAILSEDRNIHGHIHPEDFPERNTGLPAGTYAVTFPFPHEGRYIVGVDVVNPEGSLAKQFIVDVGGSPSMGRVSYDMTREKCFASYTEEGTDRYVQPIAMDVTTVPCPQGYGVIFTPPEAINTGVPARLAFGVTKNGAPVTDLAMVMGAAIHFAIVPDSFDTLLHRHGDAASAEDDHSHDEDSAHEVEGLFGPDLVSEPIVFPKEGNYTLIFEFKHHDELVYGRFDLAVEPGVEATGETKMLMVHLEGGKMSEGSNTWSVKQGDMVMFHIMADAPEEFHVHGYDESREFEANEEATLTFFADTAGRFPIELEGSKADIGVLEVQPR